MATTPPPGILLNPLSDLLRLNSLPTPFVARIADVYFSYHVKGSHLQKTIVADVWTGGKGRETEEKETERE